MKSLFLIILTSLSVTLFAQTNKTKVRYNHFKTFVIDLNNDSKDDTIVLSSSLAGKQSFNRVSISLTGIKKFLFNAKDEWFEIAPSFLSQNNNLLRSRNVFVQKSDLHTVIIVSGGTDGAGYGGEFSIMNIENNNIKMVFDYSAGDKADNFYIDVEVPVKLADLENNGRLHFVYTGYHEAYKEVKGGMIGTYNPFVVFTVDDNCRLNKTLSKKYNQQHYVYVDPAYKGEIKIFYPTDKKLKPRLWK